MDILAAGRLYIQDIGHEPCILAEGIEANEGERFFFIFLMQLLGLWWWWWQQWRWWRWRWWWWLSKILIEAAPVWSIKAKMHFYVHPKSYWFFLSSECLKLFLKDQKIHFLKAKMFRNNFLISNNLECLSVFSNFCAWNRIVCHGYT